MHDGESRLYSQYYAVRFVQSPWDNVTTANSNNYNNNNNSNNNSNNHNSSNKNLALKEELSAFLQATDLEKSGFAGRCR